MRGQVGGEEHDALDALAREHMGAAERLPHGVGAQESAARARERARHVEVPLLLVSVLGNEVDRHPGTAHALVLGDDLESDILQQVFGEVLRGFAFFGRARLKALCEVELAEIGRGLVVPRPVSPRSPRRARGAARCRRRSGRGRSRRSAGSKRAAATNVEPEPMNGSSTRSFS